jgi:hypothetical protein
MQSVALSESIAAICMMDASASGKNHCSVVETETWKAPFFWNLLFVVY